MSWLALLEKELAEKQKDGPLCSTEDESEYAYLEALASRLRAGGDETGEIERLREALPKLVDEEEREEYAPTFDWYDEHYYARIYIGKICACRRAIALYESAAREHM